jgi:uncharacterized NAD-dependent epimerase/dehydratase family protein
MIWLFERNFSKMAKNSKIVVIDAWPDEDCRYLIIELTNIVGEDLIVGKLLTHTELKKILITSGVDIVIKRS